MTKLAWVGLVATALVVGCDGNAALEQARSKAKSGDSPGALADFTRAMKADPRAAVAIKDEAEQVVVQQLPAARTAFEAGKFEDVTRFTAPMVNLPSDYPEPYLYDGLARLALSVRAVPIAVPLFREALAALNGYLTRMPVDARNAQMRYPANLYKWLVERHETLAKEHPAAFKLPFTNDFRLPLIASETGGVGGDVGFLLRAHYAERVAHAIATVADPPAEKARKLATWIASSLAPDETVDAGIARPMDVLCAGRGTAEQLAWTAVELARQLDLAAFIRTDDAPAGGMPRVFASFWTGEAWVHFDVVAGVAVDAPPTASSRFLIAGEAKSFYPRMGLVQGAIASYLGATPRLIAKSDAELALLLGLLHGRVGVADEERWQTAVPALATGQPTIDLYAAPFAIDARLREESSLQAYKNGNDRYEAYGGARLLHLAGQAAKAVAAYDDVLARPGVSDASRRDAVALRHLAVIDAAPSDGLPAEPDVAAIGAYAADPASGAWGELVRVRWGARLVALGKVDVARPVLEGVTGPRRAAALHLLGR